MRHLRHVQSLGRPVGIRRMSDDSARTSRRSAGFSTDYFMYAEDMDLCLKSQRAGRHAYVPKERAAQPDISPDSGTLGKA